MIFILHGSGNSGQQIMKLCSKIESISDSENLLLVYPDGYKHFWNECRKMANSEANGFDIDENEFFNSMIENFTVKYRVKQNQIFVIGTSGGGHMAIQMILMLIWRHGISLNGKSVSNKRTNVFQDSNWSSLGVFKEGEGVSV